jgi:hypothetical protein
MKRMTNWLAENWFNLLSAVGIISSFVFAAISLRSETKTRQTANLLTITASHRDIWKQFLNDENLARVRSDKVNLTRNPITDAELVFVNLVILHLNSVYYAMKVQLVVEYDGLRRDVAQFFSLPIPKAVWEKVRAVQNDDFVEFVEKCRNWK